MIRSMNNTWFSLKKLGVLALALGVGLPFFSSCESEDPESDARLEPVSEIPAILSAVVRMESDTYWLDVNFRDGNGDVGYDDPDKGVFFVWDSRDTSIMEWYPLPPVSPLDSSIAVDVSLSLELVKPTDNIAGSSNWSAVVQLEDRSGNRSDKVVTNVVNLN